MTAKKGHYPVQMQEPSEMPRKRTKRRRQFSQSYEVSNTQQPAMSPSRAEDILDIKIERDAHLNSLDNGKEMYSTYGKLERGAGNSLSEANMQKATLDKFNEDKYALKKIKQRVGRKQVRPSS